MIRNLVPFAKGSRNCLGMTWVKTISFVHSSSWPFLRYIFCKQIVPPPSLAYAEMNLVLAVFFRPNGPNFDLFKTNESDVLPVSDFMMPLAKPNSEGLRVVVYWLDLNQMTVGHHRWLYHFPSLIPANKPPQVDYECQMIPLVANFYLYNTVLTFFLFR